jgi:hypothetical protein
MEYFFSDKSTSLKQTIEYDYLNVYYLANIFFAMENNRHLPLFDNFHTTNWNLKQMNKWKTLSFKHMSNILMNNVINYFPTGTNIINKINIHMSELIGAFRFRGCKVPKNVSAAPFAFSNKPKRKTSRKPKKSTSRK